MPGDAHGTSPAVRQAAAAGSCSVGAAWLVMQESAALHSSWPAGGSSGSRGTAQSMT